MLPARTVEPNAENATLEELKVALEAAPNKRSYVRLAAIRALLLGYERKEVCELYGRSDRMVRLWIECFNRAGIDGLRTRVRPGHPRKVKLERLRDLIVPVLEDSSSAGQVHWTGDHIRQNVIGAVCPADGQFFSLIVDGVDTDVFQFYLDEMAQAIPDDPIRRQLLVLDNASWHKATRLNWHHFEVLFLPAYSPDFNPIERLWLRMKADWFGDFIAHSHEQLSDRLCHALQSFLDAPVKTASICSIRK